MLADSEEGQGYLARNDLQEKMDQATHVMWATGGSLVPEEEYLAFLQKGRALLA